MTIDFDNNFTKEELGLRVRAILGVPKEFLDDSVIDSPTFKLSAKRYIEKQFVEYEQTQLESDLELINIAYLYYICYLLCIGMYARVPKQMENKSTKTILQSIDWDKLALEMLEKANEIVNEILEELEDEVNFGNSFAVITDASEYPNEII